MEFKVKKHKTLDNGFEIYKVNGHVPSDLVGFYSTESVAQDAINAYMIKVIEKKENLEKELKEEKAKAKPKPKAKPAKKQPVKKTTTKK